MKNFKYVLFLTLIGFVKNTYSMNSGDEIKRPATLTELAPTGAPTVHTENKGEDNKDEAKAIAPADPSSFTFLDNINTLFKAINIGGHILQIKEDHVAYALSEDFKKAVAAYQPLTDMIARKLIIVIGNDHAQEQIGSRTYHIIPSERRVSMEFLLVNEKYREFGLGTMLIFAAFNDPAIADYSKAFVLTVSAIARSMYQNLGFTKKKGTLCEYQTDNLIELREKGTRAVVEKMFNKILAKYPQT